MKRVKVGIIGGAGYTGGEAIRILVNHDGVELVFVHSNSNAGNLLSDVHADLLGDTDMLRAQCSGSGHSCTACPR